jgi:hypothetical protein
MLGFSYAQHRWKIRLAKWGVTLPCAGELRRMARAKIHAGHFYLLFDHNFTPPTVFTFI